MKAIKLRSWSAFDDHIKRVRREYGLDVRRLDSGDTFERPVKILFRGQEDAKWKLATTLERRSSQEFHIAKYYAYVDKTVAEVESLSGSKWSFPVWPTLNGMFDKDGLWPVLPAYDYLVYLRHHGFPSPLLDWTESPYIAAYFAYLNAGTSNPAVYCYIERPNNTKVGSLGSPMITLQGPHVTTHKRHFAQRAQYTIATRWDSNTGHHVFCPHEEVFRRKVENQDVLIKLVLPHKDRVEALRQLSDYNINHFTLFQTEDSLVKTLETRYFDIERQDRIVSPPAIVIKA
jgi:hypothetical protein